MSTKFTIGDKVRYTGKFLRNTGQYTGSAGLDRWIITGFTNGDQWAITNEPADTSIYSADELETDPTLAYRRIAVGNLERVKSR
jgi:hypothetical protein